MDTECEETRALASTISVQVFVATWEGGLWKRDSNILLYRYRSCHTDAHDPMTTPRGMHNAYQENAI